MKFAVYVDESTELDTPLLCGVDEAENNETGWATSFLKLGIFSSVSLH